MSFTAPKFTVAGRQLHTRVLAGDTLTFTTIKLGDGTVAAESMETLTDVFHSIVSLPVQEVRRNTDYADVMGVFQNAGLQSGFYWREIGLYAADPDYPDDRSYDILYCYQNAAELAEYIPSASSAVIEKIIHIACVVGEAENITIGVLPQSYVTVEQHKEEVDRIDAALAEKADKSDIMTDLVPTTRKINGKTLNKDITLSAADVEADEDGAADQALTDAKTYTDRAIQSAIQDTWEASY